MKQSEERGTLLTTGRQQIKPSSLWFTAGSNNALGQNTHPSLKQSQEHRGNEKQDKKKPERGPAERGSLQSTSRAELTTYSSYAMGDYLQKYRQSSASLLSLSPPTITTLLHFLGLSSLEPLEMSFQVPFVDAPEANGTIQ